MKVFLKNSHQVFFFHQFNLYKTIFLKKHIKIVKVGSTQIKLIVNYKCIKIVKVGNIQINLVKDNKINHNRSKI